MLNTREKVVHLLLSRGLLDSCALVDGRVLVYDASSRHQNVVVLVRAGEGFFVKQAKLAEASSFLEREAACYAMSNENNGIKLSSLATLMPRFYSYDQSRNLLILEALPDAENLLFYHSRTGGFPVELASAIGNSLAILHSKVRRPAEHDKSFSGLFPGKIPWILLAHTQSPAPLDSLSAAILHLLEILNRYPDFDERLRALRDRWRTVSLIHGDIKFANLIRYSSGVKSNLKLIDWECADIGDPLWDVGGVFHAYLHFCISAARTIPESRSHEFYRRVQAKLDEMKPAIGAFWRAYQNTFGLDARVSKSDLELSVSYGAVRLLQTAFETSLLSRELDCHDIHLLQCSMNILKSPEHARIELFGIEA